jgi:hypothetical protein
LGFDRFGSIGFLAIGRSLGSLFTLAALTLAATLLATSALAAPSAATAFAAALTARAAILSFTAVTACLSLAAVAASTAFASAATSSASTSFTTAFTVRIGTLLARRTLRRHFGFAPRDFLALPWWTGGCGRRCRHRRRFGGRRWVETQANRQVVPIFRCYFWPRWRRRLFAL